MRVAGHFVLLRVEVVDFGSVKGTETAGVGSGGDNGTGQAQQEETISVLNRFDLQGTTRNERILMKPACLHAQSFEMETQNCKEPPALACIGLPTRIRVGHSVAVH